MLLPFAVYVVLHFAVTLRVASPLPTYVSALWPPLYIICGVLLARAMRDYGMPRWSQIAFLLAAVAALAYQAYGSFVVPGRERQETPMIRAVNLLQASADTEQILVDQRFVPTLNYYLPDRRFPIFREGEMGWQELAKQAQTQDSRGLLYSGDRHEELRAELSRYFHISVQVLGRRAAFYSLTPRTK